MLPDNIEHCIVFMNYWGMSGVFWSFSKCNITIPHLPADPSIPPRTICILSAGAGASGAICRGVPCTRVQRCSGSGHWMAVGRPGASAWGLDWVWSVHTSLI